MSNHERYLGKMYYRVFYICNSESQQINKYALHQLSLKSFFKHQLNLYLQETIFVFIKKKNKKTLMKIKPPEYAD